MSNDHLKAYRRPGESLDENRARLRAVVDQSDADALAKVLSGIAGGDEFMHKAIEVFGGRQAGVNWMAAPALALGRKRPLESSSALKRDRSCSTTFADSSTASGRSA